LIISVKLVAARSAPLKTASDDNFMLSYVIADVSDRITLLNVSWELDSLTNDDCDSWPRQLARPTRTHLLREQLAVTVGQRSPYPYVSLSFPYPGIHKVQQLGGPSERQRAAFMT